MIMMPKGPKPATRSHRTAPYPSTIMSSQTTTVTPLGQSSMGNERPSTAWSHDDDLLLIRSRAQRMNWAPIAQNHFPKKTPNACRKRHERLMEKKSAEDWDSVKLENLAKAYIESREMMWKIVADKIGEKWEHAETKCMEKGLKTLRAAANSRRNKDFSTSPTSPADENDFNDSGLGPDQGPGGPGSDAGNLDLSSNPHQQSGHLHSHQQSHSHHENSSNSTPGATYANLHSSFHSRGSNSRSSVSSVCPPGAYQQHAGQVSMGGHQQTLPSFNSSFSQLPSLTTGLTQGFLPSISAVTF